MTPLVAYAYVWEQSFNLNIGFASNCETKVTTSKKRHLKCYDNQERVEVITCKIKLFIISHLAIDSTEPL